MIESLNDLPENVIGWELVGKVTDEDYRTVLVPMVDAAHQHHQRIRAICVLGDRFESFSAGAVWVDAKLGVTHPRSWERIALVSDIDWLKHLASGFAWAVPGELKVFPLAALPDAKNWIAE